MDIATLKMLLFVLPMFSFSIAFLIGYSLGKSDAMREVMEKYRRICGRCERNGTKSATFSILMDSKDRFHDFVMKDENVNAEKERNGQ